MKLNLSLLIMITIWLSSSAYSQIYDDFSDGDFTNNPEWTGTAHLFRISDDFRLQLNALEAGDAWLFVTHEYECDSLEWNFFIRLGFSPSSNNMSRFYLAASTPDPEEPSLEAFYLQFGENGTSDAIEFYHQKSGEHRLLCRGTDGLISSSFSCYVKVIKHKSDLWEIFIDKELNGNYRLECRFTSPFISYNKALGIMCRYTQSNANKFYFDDIYLGPPLQDTLIPKITDIYGEEDLRSVSLLWNKNMPDSNILDPFHYRLEDRIYPLCVRFSEGNRKGVTLFFENSLQEKTPYSLSVSGIRDRSGNRMKDTVLSFLFYRPQRHDIVISEIMANPKPVIGLPESEYIELYNRTEFPVRMKNWQLETGKNNRVITETGIPPKGRVIIIAAADSPLFGTIPSVAVSSMSIANNGQRISIYNSRGETMHTVEFKNSWHRQPVKRQGGWSLEMIDTDNPCGDGSNWDSSLSARGGTPGQENSVSAPNPDFRAPAMTTVTVLDSVKIRVIFNETILIPPGGFASCFEIDHENQILHAHGIEPENRIVEILFEKPLRPSTIYTLISKDTITDCAGWILPRHSFVTFGIPQEADRSDLIINEFVTHPFSNTNGKYLEIYNRSDKIIDLRSIKIGMGGSTVPDKAILAAPDGYQLFPESYFVLCADRKSILENYTVPYPERLLSSDTFPNYARSSGTIHITDLALQPIDRLHYTDKMHYEMLHSTEGVALERIHPDSETQNNAHWKSAAASAGFGTPGYRNSQFTEQDATDDLLMVQPDIISPDQDGFHDYCLISCHFPEGDNRVTISIFDGNGYKIKTIANNMFCGTEAQFSWDGMAEKGYKAPPGIYVVLMEYWNIAGKTKRIKKAVAVR